MIGKNKFKIIFPQTVYWKDATHEFNMVLEFKIFRGKLKVIVRDARSKDDE